MNKIQINGQDIIIPNGNVQFNNGEVHVDGIKIEIPELIGAQQIKFHIDVDESITPNVTTTTTVNIPTVDISNEPSNTLNEPSNIFPYGDEVFFLSDAQNVQDIITTTTEPIPIKKKSKKNISVTTTTTNLN